MDLFIEISLSAWLEIRRSVQLLLRRLSQTKALKLVLRTRTEELLPALCSQNCTAPAESFPTRLGGFIFSHRCHRFLLEFGRNFPNQQLSPGYHPAGKRFGKIRAWLCEHSAAGGALFEPVRVSFAPPAVISGAAKLL